MPRRKNPITPGVIYHFTNQGHNRSDIYVEPHGFERFMDGLLSKIIGPQAATLLAYALMPNHYHLLIDVKTEDFRELFRGFLISYSKSFNIRNERVGSLCRGRYSAERVADDAYLRTVSRYIHINPVKDGYVERPEEWPYSSYGDYVGINAQGLAAPERVLTLFGDVTTTRGLAACRRAYKRFVGDWRRSRD
ncbi:MAG: transposase [Anaerolineales bacterium]|nr:transposase [Anaerolineales bacterium]